MPFQIEKLNEEVHHFEDFDCGSSSLNNYLRRHAWQNQLRQIAICYVAVDAEESPKYLTPEHFEGEVETPVCGYYTLSSGSVEFENAPERYKEREGMPRYPVPTTLIGKLAVDKSQQGKGLGEAILLDAIARAVYGGAQIGSAAVEVHAANEEARQFYKKYGFVGLQDDENHLFLSTKVARSVAEDIDMEIPAFTREAPSLS